LLAEVV
jgi:hypothetical protein